MNYTLVGKQFLYDKKQSASTIKIWHVSTMVETYSKGT